MTQDVVRQLGYLCLGSRLKRIGDRLQADVSRFNEGEGVSIQPAQCTMLAALDRQGALTVGELADALGVSQPGVTRNVTRLVELGLLETGKGGADQRHKTVRLSKSGREMVKRSKRDVWPHIEAAVRELCEGRTGALLDQLGAIEDALAHTPLDRRAAKHARLRK
jgi:DNA-binding MarR family transcriptional regulator